ncbi:MAG: hypothetical protein K8S20_12470 [Chloroflexi bacterium]|nr:hypothetical protein [Chloroflexota bacterium]
MSLLLEGWSVFSLYTEALLVLLVTVFGLGSWGVRILFKDELPGRVFRFLTVLSLGILLLTWLSLLMAALGRIWFPAFTFAAVLLPVLSLAYLLWDAFKRMRAPMRTWQLAASAGIGLILFALLLIRLAFLKGMLLPPYDDSPDHYLIVQALLAPGPSAFGGLEQTAENYYHIGFHAVTAWLVNVSHSDGALGMAVLGQFFIWFAPLSIFFLVLVITDNLPAGFAAAVFAGFAWKMPAFAANWGKYPALTALVMLPAWLGLFWLFRARIRSKPLSNVFSILIVLGLILLHTRMVICLTVIAIAWWIVQRLKLSGSSRTLQLVLLTGLTLLWPLLFLKNLQIFYSNLGYLALGILAVLAPFAALKYPRHLAVIGLSMLAVGVAARTPVFFYGSNWLDAPFVQILLFIPLSLIAGLGFSGLSETFDHPISRALALLIPVVMLLLGLGPWNAYHPDPCCQYAGAGDLKALNWIKANTRLDSVVWVAGFKPKNYMIGTDAGVWVNAWTGRNTNKLKYDFNWDFPSTLQKVCRRGYIHVYVYQGGQDFSFDHNAMSDKPWLDPVFEDNDARVYRVYCPDFP